jgi:hypothetical protein
MTAANARGPLDAPAEGDEMTKNTEAEQGSQPQIAIEWALLDIRRELTSQPLTPERREEIAACDRLLARLQRIRGLPPRPPTEKERLLCDKIMAILDRLAAA